MLILALDSSNQAQSLAVFDDIEQRFIIETQQQSKSSKLISLLVESFQEAGLKPEDIGLLACSVGPGSFTGIRSTITIVKTLAAELDLKIYAVNNFRLTRFENQLSDSDPVIIAAGKNDYFISLDTDYTNLKTNFFSLETNGHKVYELRENNIASLIIKTFNAQEPLINYKDLQPYYLREPSINVKAG
jgi:tRNA threonylcarbamoyl adenosine modification protein YeaZ